MNTCVDRDDIVSLLRTTLSKIKGNYGVEDALLSFAAELLGCSEDTLVSDIVTDDVDQVFLETYSDYEHWAYDWYKLQWCVQRDFFPEHFDEEVGVNGECYVSIDEFVHNELADITISKAFLLEYTLCSLLEWIRDKCSSDFLPICREELKMGEAEINAYTDAEPMNIAMLKKVFSAYRKERISKEKELIGKVLKYILEEADVYYGNFAREFIVDMGLSQELIQEFIEIPGTLSKNEYFSRLDSLQDRCTKIGADFSRWFIDYEHLNCFWYAPALVACISYKGCDVQVFVRGKTDAHLYDENGYIKMYIRNDRAPSLYSNTRSLYSNSGVLNEVKNDLILNAITSNKLEFFIHPWIEVCVYDKNDVLKVYPQKTENVLEALENSFNDSIRFIDHYRNREEKNEGFIH